MACEPNAGVVSTGRRYAAAPLLDERAVQKAAGKKAVRLQNGLCLKGTGDGFSISDLTAEKETNQAEATRMPRLFYSAERIPSRPHPLRLVQVQRPQLQRRKALKAT